MDNCVLFVLAVLFSSTLSVRSPRMTKRYRTDYVYNRQTDAFYKLHIETRRGWAANSEYKMEGASLMKPGLKQDIKQLYSMLRKFPDMGKYVWVASDGRAHEAAEEKTIIKLDVIEDHLPYGFGCIVVSRNEQIETMPCFMSLPFICKVEAKDAPYDPHCDVVANNYNYSAALGSCYGIPRRVASWNEAYAECRKEGAHLVVLNSEAERVFVQDLIKSTPEVAGAKTSWFFFAGYRANKPVGNETIVYKTIFNQTLEEAGFAEWSPNEPNNALGNEYCGTIFKNDGKLNDVDCSHEYAFVCEKEVSTQT